MSVAAAAARAPAIAHPNESTVTELLTMPAAIQRTPASSTRTTRNPLSTVNGSRIRAMAGTISAFRMPMTATTPNAPSTPSTPSPGRTTAAAKRPATASVQPTSKLRRLRLGLTAIQAGLWPACVSTGRESSPPTSSRLLSAIAPLGFDFQMLKLVVERGVQRSLKPSVEEAGDQSVIGLFGPDQRTALPGLEGVHVGRLDAERRARPDDPPRRIDVLDRRRDRPRPCLPAELRAFFDPLLERDGCDCRIPARPASDRRQDVPGNVRSRGHLNVTPAHDGSVIVDPG